MAVQLFLKGAKVDPDFREAVFDAANREGVSVNEFCIVAAAEKLAGRGASFPGIFRPNDFETVGFHMPPESCGRTA